MRNAVRNRRINRVLRDIALRTKVIVVELSRVLPTAQVDAAKARVSSVAVARHAPVPHLLDACWEWRHNITLQDGVYVALAHLLRAPLATTDDRLARAAGDLIKLIQ